MSFLAADGTVQESSATHFGGSTECLSHGMDPRFRFFSGTAGKVCDAESWVYVVDDHSSCRNWFKRRKFLKSVKQKKFR